MNRIFHFFLVIILFGRCEESTNSNYGLVELKLNPVLNTITYQGNNLVYSTWDSTINIFDIDQNKIKNKITLNNICYVKPLLKAGKLYFPISDRKFKCIELITGTTLWEIDLNGRCSSIEYIEDSLLIVSAKHYGLLAVNINTGKLVYELKFDNQKSQIPDLSPWPISWDDENIYISNWQGNTLSSYKKENGKLNWHFNSDSLGIAGTSILLGDEVFIGINNFYKNGKIFLIRKNDGKLLKTDTVNYEERIQPILYEGKIFFYSYDGNLNEFNSSKREIKLVKSFEKDFDLSGYKLFLASDRIYYTDASYYLNTYVIKEKKFFQLHKIDKQALFVFEHGRKTYFIT